MGLSYRIQSVFRPISLILMAQEGGREGGKGGREGGERREEREGWERREEKREGEGGREGRERWKSQHDIPETLPCS